MRRFELSQYLNTDCFQVERGPSFTTGIALYHATGGNMCNGCPAFKVGSCKDYKKLISDSDRDTSTFTYSLKVETVREEATRRGISINAVRRERNSR